MFEQARRNAIAGVLFVEDFDEEVAGAESSRVPVPAGDAHEGDERPHSQQPAVDLDLLTAEARREGFSAGLQAAEDKVASQRLALLAEIGSALEAASRAWRVTAEEDAKFVAHVALSMLAESLPAFYERHGADEMLRLLRTVLPTLDGEPKLTINVADEVVGLVRNEVSLLPLATRDLISIVPGREMLPGDVLITWQDGTASRDVRRLRTTMLERLAEVGLLEPDREDRAA